MIKIKKETIKAKQKRGVQMYCTACNAESYYCKDPECTSAPCIKHNRGGIQHSIFCTGEIKFLERCKMCDSKEHEDLGHNKHIFDVSDLKADIEQLRNPNHVLTEKGLEDLAILLAELRTSQRIKAEVVRVIDEMDWSKDIITLLWHPLDIPTPEQINDAIKKELKKRLFG